MELHYKCVTLIKGHRVCKTGCPPTQAKAENSYIVITAIKGLLCVRHCLRQFTHILFNPFNNAVKYYPHFKDEESGLRLVMGVL